jgi:hypothetical protein
LTLFHNLLKEAAKDFDPIALTDTGETRVIGQWLTQIIAQVPQNAEPISRMTHQLPFGAYSFKKHDELQLEEDDGINGGTTILGIALLHKLTNECQVEGLLQVVIKVIWRNEVL